MKTSAQIGDTKRILWARILTLFQNRPGSNPSNNLQPLDSRRQIIVKVLKSLIGFTTRVNLIPSGAVFWSVNNPLVYEIDGLPENTSYGLTWGINEVSISIGGSTIPNPGQGQSSLINTGIGTQILIRGTSTGIPVTATLYAI